MRRRFEKAAKYCRFCCDYSARIESGGEKKDLERMHKLRDNARQVARRAVRSDGNAIEYNAIAAKAIASCNTCNYKIAKIDNLFYALMQSDRG
jgi:hypothetical protein